MQLTEHKIAGHPKVVSRRAYPHYKCRQVEVAFVREFRELLRLSTTPFLCCRLSSHNYELRYLTFGQHIRQTNTSIWRTSSNVGFSLPLVFNIHQFPVQVRNANHYEKHTMMIHCGTVNPSNQESIHAFAFWMTKSKSLNVSASNSYVQALDKFMITMLPLK